ncbi:MULTISPECIES: winged helix-turn-helix domain-containing protein [Sulfolobaceae]|uniref:CTP-dependent riboflavin kinase n=1 Tax=Sulfurisphaera ohwakuensis TaxID=69656 RepID=A0A650CHK3_SULOH|nr:MULTISPECIES: winged helix-turn-helix domain-containing protein [Sulfolobaceae]MBB5252539.1 CTP-dependent riboflavin kinase [Sulfurisphaera ohwakuensis]QGR17017.1 winged helix-turn-helix domain-containing protein [Sulfurisphaera ohwakuensis]QIW24185.1 winged helix-turn-helix domain-containing protein [Sulfolobus sp. S-194]
MESTTSSYEDLAYQKIKEAGDNGIPQKDLIKELGLSTKEASLIIKKLIEKKKIIKRSVKENGKSILKLFAIDDDGIDIYVSLSSIIEIPCYTCKILKKCGNGSYISPSTCPQLSKYLLTNAKSAS